MTIDQKIRALLAKTVKNGCTPAEQETATAKARGLVKQYGLKESSFIWPAPPPKADPTKPAQRPDKPQRPAKAAKPQPRAAKPAKAPKKGLTRAEELMAMLHGRGATIDEIVAAMGILPHTARAIISVQSRKMGLKVERVGKAHYRIVD